jgi:ketosteroid isomerase-like protein
VDGRLAQCVTVQDGKITEVVPYYWDTATYAAACS